MKTFRSRCGLAARWIAFAAVGAAISACGCSTTQPVPDMSARFYSVHAAMQSSGLSQVGSVSRGRLAEGQSVKLPVELTGECLTVVAMGDRGVADLSLSLRDAEGKEVARDDMIGPDASFRYCPEQPGKHALLLRMAKGGGGYAFSTWVGGMPTHRAESSSEGQATVEGGGTCDAPTVIVAGQTYVGDTDEGHEMEEGSCGNTAANELVYRLDLPSRQRVTIDVRAQYDAVLYVRRGDCTDPDAEVACNDDAPGGGRRSRVDEVLDAGTYFVFVDGYGEEQGAYRMTVRMRPAPSARQDCETAPVLALRGAIRGNTANHVNRVKASCGNDGAGPDRPFRLDLASRSRVRITERARGFSPVVHMRTNCGDIESEVGCSSEGMARGEASLLGAFDKGSYFVFADASAEGASGDFILETQSVDAQGVGTVGDTCGEAISIGDEAGVASGDTFPARDDILTGCGAHGTADVVYRLDLLRRARLSARIRKEQGTHQLALQPVCGAPAEEISCGETIDRVLSPGTYWLVVQDASVESFGRFELAYRIQDVAATESACKNASPLVPGHPLTGSITAAGNHFAATCAGPPDRQKGPDRVYAFSLARRSHVVMNLQATAFQPVLSLRHLCAEASSEMGCRAARRGGRPLQLDRTLDPGKYFAVVSGRDPDDEGDFVLSLQVVGPRPSRRSR